MKNFLTAFFIFLIWSFFGLWVYSWVQEKDVAIKGVPEKHVKKVIDNLKNKDDFKNTVQDSVITNSIDKDSTSSKTSALNTLRIINENGEPVFLFSEAISTFKDSIVLIIPDTIQKYTTKIKKYCINKPKQELHVLSFYSPLEGVMDPNIGIQRGNEIKKALLEVGVSSEKIVIKSIIKNVKFTENDTLKNCISFIFKPLNLNRVEEFKSLKKITKNIYPTFSENGILANQELYDLLNEINNLRNQFPDLKIQIIGHTDSIGNPIDNYNVGLKYARQVRWFLIAKGGLNKNQIVATSKGESEAIESNKTKKGRELNRRIEVIIN